MKLECTKQEFVELVRNCSPDDGCNGCVFYTVCSIGGEPYQDSIMERIEDICEIGGGADG